MEVHVRRHKYFQDKNGNVEADIKRTLVILRNCIVRNRANGSYSNQGHFLWTFELGGRVRFGSVHLRKCRSVVRRRY